MQDIKEIITTIEGGNKENRFRKVIKIYIFKLFFNLIGKKYDEMITNYNFKSKGITFTDLLLDNTNENKYIKEIICEEKSPTEKIYEGFPLLKYFVYTEYKTIIDFLGHILSNQEKYMNKYPLLYKYLMEIQNKKSNVSKLENLYVFNKFNNKMIDNYSFNITREEAKNKILKEENLYSEQIFTNLFEAFIESWEVINNQAIQYKDYPKMDVKYLNEEDQLIYFLNDVNEQGYGMYLASAYQNFISWQNEFLQYIIDNGKDKINLSSYIDNMKRRIPIHNASENQTVLIRGCFNEHPDYTNFEDCVNLFTKRKIFNKTGNINYSNYNNFEYDVSGIEEELAKVLLPGKCLFEEENDYFVTFWGEGFNGGKSDFLQKFYKKFKQTDLEQDEKEKVMSYLKLFKLANDFRQFFTSMQIFLFYLMSYNFNENDTISNIFNQSNENLKKLNESCTRFFNNENIKDFKGEKILSIFFLFEHFCFEELCQNLQEEYKEEIDEKVKANIETKLLNPNNYVEEISIKDLGSAVRRFISRYLVGKKQATNIDPNAKLLQQLKRVDLWGEKIGKKKNLDILITNLIGEFNLNVCESYRFYEIIKEEDAKEINIEDEQEEEIVHKPKKKNKKRI